jgi:hypothetical protein
MNLQPGVDDHIMDEEEEGLVRSARAGEDELKEPGGHVEHRDHEDLDENLRNSV